MSCNLNFHGCCPGPYYPRPINTCACKLFSLLNNSTNTVINPPVVTSWAFFSSIATQTVPSSGNVLLNIISGSGSDISLGNNGHINLAPGTYQIAFSANGVIPAGGTLSLALYQDSVIVPGSTASVSGSVGAATNLSGSTVITTATNGSTISLVNILPSPITFNSVSMTITRLQ